jgi:hypothetical protein
MGRCAQVRVMYGALPVCTSSTRERCARLPGRPGARRLCNAHIFPAWMRLCRMTGGQGVSMGRCNAATHHAGLSRRRPSVGGGAIPVCTVAHATCARRIRVHAGVALPGGHYVMAVTGAAGDGVVEHRRNV